MRCKKILAIVLASIMILSSVPLAELAGLAAANLSEYSLGIFAQAQETEISDETVTASGTCGENLTWVLYENGMLVISGTGEMDDYYENAPWYNYRASIKSVTIEYGVTNIGSYAFEHCYTLVSITIPCSVTVICPYAFGSCESLVNITIPASVTSIAYNAFNDCTGLENIIVDENNNSYFSDSNGVLFNKNKTELIQYPAGNVENSYLIPNSVIIISDYAFYCCDNLESITIPSSVTTIGDYAFSCCTALKSLIIPNSVTNIGEYAFSYCTNLECITISDATTSIGYSAFSYCESLVSVTIPNSVTLIDTKAFSYCESLVSITIPDSVTIIGSEAFYYCKSLETITIPDSVTSIGSDVFSHCGSLKSIIIPDSVTSIHIGTFEDCYSLANIVIPESVTSIGSYAFADCGSLENIIIPDSVTSIGNHVFYGCESLESITIPDSVTNIGTAVFADCSRLETIIIPNSVTSIGSYAFSDCGSLTSITLSDSVTNISEGAFSGCESLSKITIFNPECEIYDSSYTIDSVATIVGYAGSTAQAYAEKYGRTFEAIGDHTFESVVTEPTCTENGYTTHTCTDCGYSYKDTYVDATGHTDINNDYICEVCGKNVSDILVDETKPIDITAYEITYLMFIPEYDGEYTFYSSSDDDTYGYLFDANKYQLAYNDDGDWDYNFSITYELEAGKVYYWGARFYSSSKSGSFNVTLEAKCNHPDANFDGICDNCGESSIVASGTCGDNLTWVIYGDTLVISGEGEMNASPWHNYSDYIKTVIMENGVTSIVSSAFYGCDNIGSITIFNPECAIYDSSYTIARVATIIGQPGSTAQAYAKKYERTFEAIKHNFESIVTAPTCAESGYTTYVCKDCGYSYVDSYVDVTDHNFESVVIEPTCTENGYTTHTCKDCGYSYSNSYVEAVGTHMDVDFDGLCDNCIESSIVASGICGDNLTWVISGVVCLIRGEGDTYNFERYNNVMPWYNYREHIVSVIIDNGVTNIGSFLFYDCDNLETIEIAGSVTNIGPFAFDECDKLKNIEINTGVTNIDDYAFSSCDKLESIKIPESIVNIGDYAFYECDNLKNVEINTGVTSIGEHTFSSCDKLESIEIPDSVTSIGYCAFYDCRKLESIIIPRNITRIGDMAFSNCYSIKSITVDAFNAIYSSDECGALFDKNKTTLIQFPTASDITEYTIPRSVTNIVDFAFYCCFNLESIEIPDGVTCIGDFAFGNCYNLEKIEIPISVTSIDDYAFCGCSNLESIEIPNSITSIRNGTFEGCYKLDSIEIPDGVTSIGAIAFNDCDNLISIEIPDSVANIDMMAFDECDNLERITILNPKCKIYFDGDTISSSATIYGYKDSTAQAYAEKYNRKFVAIDVSDSGEEFAETLQYGADRFSFGEKIEGYVGESVNSLVLYESKSNDTTSLAFTSSNTDIVEIGEIAHGTGEYITLDNQHIAIIPLEFKMEGTSIITITSPEGLSVNVTVEVSKIPEEKKSIAIFTTEKSLTINTGDSMWLGFGLFNENTGLIEENWRKMAITVSDPTIISLSDYEETEYGYSLEVIGKKEGATNVTITDTQTGISTIIVITVRDSFVQTFSYAIDNMTVFYPNNKWEDHIATNVYDLNGLYVNNYQCVKNGDTYKIDFDVYNSRYYAGAVDIYDANGMWIGYEEISKFSDISSLWGTIEQAYYLITNTAKALNSVENDSNLLTYEQESFSKNTHISLELHEGEYFTISNNVGTSPGAFFINAFEIIFDAAYVVLDLVTSDSVKTHALSDFKKNAAKTFADRLIEARNEGLKNELKKKAQKVMLGTMQSEINKITKNFVNAEIKDKLVMTDDLCSEMASLAENVLSAYNISWKHLLQSALGITESAFSTFAGPAGVALKGCFAITKATNKLLMATQMAMSTKKPYVSVFSTIEEGYINPYGVIVNTAENMDTEAVLQVFRVSDDDTIDVILDNANPFEQHELYNICFVKNDQLVQPNGKVTVYIPIPNGMKSNTCKVYRQESDESWTILDAHIEGNYLVFETEHFSLYAVIGNMDNLSVHSIPDKIVYNAGDSLDTTGLVLNLNGELITEGFVCEPNVLSGVGTLKITVRYANATTDFNVRIRCSNDSHSGGTANCEDKAICSVCGEAYGAVNPDNHKNVVTDKAVSATCSATGLTEGKKCSDCGEILVKQTEIPKLEHSFTSFTGKAPTCTDGGFTTLECSKCDYSETTDIPAAGHEYADGVCVYCGESQSVNCDHICHKSGFMGFIWKIVQFFWRLFKMNPVCECGAAHY